MKPTTDNKLMNQANKLLRVTYLLLLMLHCWRPCSGSTRCLS
jgi:hypothetical protein